MSNPLDRPNHFFDDSLGDPAECTEDHNHPTLEERMSEAAENAECARCRVKILSESSKAGVVFGRLIVPILGVKHEYQLCGKCGLGLREFIFPGILDDQVYLGIKHRLLTEHWA